VGEMDDTGHVGFVELNPSRRLEIESHGATLPRKEGNVTECGTEWALDGPGVHP
jgi:hypothetical protein